MLHILIILLKIIGSLLVTVIGILLLAIIFVLLVPVRYCIEADGKLGEEEPLWIEIKITWLMHLISAIFSYPENTGLRIKIFGIPVFDSARKKEKKSLKGKKSSEEKKLLKEKKPLKEKDKNAPPSCGGGNDDSKEEIPEGVKTQKCSTTVLESGWFRKGEHKLVFAYAVETACDKHGWILGYSVHPGNEHDSRAFIALYSCPILDISTSPRALMPYPPQP